ncbi:MAG: hypothetical protein O9315_11195 [Beijerinckiaceae bacterium]|nr:hypothetical protein [Beijerinckiaceae bacterium]
MMKTQCLDEKHSQCLEAASVIGQIAGEILNSIGEGPNVRARPVGSVFVS